MTNDNMLRLADYVMEWLASKGARTVFTVSGGGSITLCDALLQSEKLDYICCHHEQSVSMAAEGYTRASGKLGVCLVTTGPGGTNAITGAASAWIDSIPQIIISGQVYLNQTIGDTGLRQLGVQEINIIDLVKPVTKYAVMIEDPSSIKYHLEKAYHLATSGRPGPVWLDIPANFQNAIIDRDKLLSFDAEQGYELPTIAQNDVQAVADHLLKSKRPILHVGQGVRSQSALSALFNLIEKHHLAVATTWNATDIIPSNHPNYIGRPGAFAERGANFAVQNSDFFLSIGSRLPYMVTGYNSKDFARNAYRITVDIDPAETAKESLDMHMRITGDATDFIEKLANALPSDWKADGEWIDQCQALRRKYPIVLPKYRTQERWVNSYYFIDKLSDLLEEEAIVVTDMGLSFVGTHQAFKVKRGQKVFTNSGHAAMGWGLPAAIGAALSAKNKDVICLTGEGGLMMNIQELATVMHNKVPLKMFIYNNGGYLTIKQTQQLGFNGRLMGATEDSGISFPDFRKLADAYALPYAVASSHQELDDLLEEFLKQDGPAICELIMDPEQSQEPKAINKKHPDGTTEPTKFEDLYPFLDPDELKENLLDD